MMDELERRIEALEMANAHQNRIIDDLNDVVREQGERIGALTQNAMRLRDRLTEVEEGAGGPHENTKPPHY